MPIDAEWRSAAVSRPQDGGYAPLDAVASDLYADLRLTPLLRRLLERSRLLLGAMAGSISLVDSGRERYAKMAEHGASCQLGHSFSLAEGVTGAVMARRQPVVLDRYSDIAVGHLPTGHPAHGGAVAAVPIWWRGDVIGANVVFAGRQRRYTTAEVDDLEVLTHVAAAGIVHAGAVAVQTTAPRAAARGSLPSSPDERLWLTAREQQVLGLVSLGLSNAQLAHRLMIAPKTVEKHVAAILRKTGSPNRTSAVMAALERGWLPREGSAAAR
jgi:DNA-binding CsgD family transcriptional regulator